ncbi:tetratricopeptide repeat protein [Nitrospira sp. Kam-Ns4a]
MRRLPAGAPLRLNPFGKDDVGKLVESMAGPVPREVHEVVARLATGSPFMAAAVLHGLVEIGALVADGAGWRVEPAALAKAQSSYRAAVFLTRRLERLSAEALHLLSVGAVLGKEFEVKAARLLAGLPPDQVIAGLEEARRRHLVWVDGGTGHCSFVHDKIRDAVLLRLSETQRRELHRQAALHMEAECPDQRFELAYHFDAAGEPERALPYALAAAEQARRQFALASAEQQYRIADRGAAGAEAATRYRIAEGLGDVLMLRGRYDDAQAQFERARSLAKTSLARAQIEGKLGELAFKRGDVKAASEAIERALRLLGQRVPRRRAGYVGWLCWEAFVQALHTWLPGIFVSRRTLEGAEEEFLAIRLYSRLAYVYWFQRGTVPCFWAHLREMNLAERYPPTPELAKPTPNMHSR